MARRFENVIVPMLSPLTADERIDLPALRRMVDFLLDARVDAIFVLGSNGEGPALRPSERRRLATETVQAVAGRCAVIAGAIEPSTSRVIDEIPTCRTAVSTDSSPPRRSTSRATATPSSSRTFGRSPTWRRRRSSLQHSAEHACRAARLGRARAGRHLKYRGTEG